jgi:hypothetical protein
VRRLLALCKLDGRLALATEHPSRSGPRRASTWPS